MTTLRREMKDGRATPGDIAVPSVPDRLLPAFVSPPALMHALPDTHLSVPSGTVVLVLATRNGNKVTLYSHDPWRDMVLALIDGRPWWVLGSDVVPT